MKAPKLGPSLSINTVNIYLLRNSGETKISVIFKTQCHKKWCILNLFEDNKTVNY